MNINYLINKYGAPVYQNEVPIKWFVDEEDISYLNIKIKKYSSINYKKVLIKNKVAIDDRFKDEAEKEYLVYDIHNVYKKAKLIYSEVIIFEDDFDKDIEIYTVNKTKEISGTPRVEKQVLRTKGRIKELSPSDPLAIPFYPEGAQITHIITIPYDENIVDIRQSIIKWGSNDYEIKRMENINNMDRLIMFYCQKRISIL